MAPRRETRFVSHMSDAEALMWTIERDPMLSSNIATLFICEQPLDLDILRSRLSHACEIMPRLRERVAPSIRGIAPPRWVPDPDFQLDNHFAVISLTQGDEAELLDLAARLINDPFDSTRPLWQFTVIDGLDKNRSAFVAKMHHTLTDGIGALRLSEAYLDFERNPKDLDAAVLEAKDPAPLPSDGHPTEFTTTVTTSVKHFMRRQLGLVRQAAAEVSMWEADPGRATKIVKQTEALVTTAGSQLGLSRLFNSDDNVAKGPSPLWGERSRNRDLVTLSFDAKKGLAAAKTLGGTFNDLILAATVIASKRVHDAHDVSIDHVNTSFVLSTRNDGAVGGNSFTPIPVRLPTNFKSVKEAFSLTKMVLEKRKDSARVEGGAGLELVAGFAAGLPSAVICSVVRDRAAFQDYATSNLRGSPIPLYLAGALVEEMYPVGPVAGTAWNLTVITYADRAEVGVMVDQAAVVDPQELRDALDQAFTDLIAAAEPKKASARSSKAKK